MTSAGYSFNYFSSAALAVLGVLGICSVARADIIYVDTGAAISSYLLGASVTSSAFSGTPGASVMSMVVTPNDVLLTAAYASNGIYQYSSGGVPTLLASITAPKGLTIDGAGNIYVGADTNTSITNGYSIEELHPNGTAYTNSIATGVYVGALAVDSKGDVFEADDYSGDIVEYLAGGGGSKVYADLSSLFAPFYGMAFDGAGDLFVSYQTGSSSGGVEEITALGAKSVFYNATTSLPGNLAYDSSSGVLYMSYDLSSTGPGGGVLQFSAGTAGAVLAAHTTFESSTQGTLYAVAYAAPEPGTWLLFAAGLVLTWLFRSRLVRA